MTYNVANNEVKIALDGVSYVVNLTSTPSAFHVKSNDGTQITVSSTVAAKLFGAEKAISVLNTLYGANSSGTSLIQDSVNSLRNEYISASTILIHQDLLGTLSGIGSLL